MAMTVALFLRVMALVVRLARVRKERDKFPVQQLFSGRVSSFKTSFMTFL
jgi:hypothetical protein